MNIPIPDIFRVKNRMVTHRRTGGQMDYGIATSGKGKASDCIRCGQCERVCPQQLSIIKYLEECAGDFE